MSENLTQSQLQEALENAKKEILAGGVSGISSAGKSVSFLSLKDLQDFEARENLKNSGPIIDSIQNTPYNPNW